jgi:hypothetical protein
MRFKKWLTNRMNSSLLHLLGVFVIGIAIGLYLSQSSEGFQSGHQRCEACGDDSPCNCPSPKPRVVCPACGECKQPDMTKYVLKSSIPPCPSVPDMSNYILKSECPPVPDLSNYVLKSSIPKQNPVILDCSKCNKPKGECPPCPRPRCPEVICPPAPKCPACAPCPRPSCPPPPKVKCTAEEPAEAKNSMVRPYLSPLSYSGFGRD